MTGMKRSIFVFSTPMQRAPAKEDIAKNILGIDSANEPDRARKALDSHFARARWMTEVGYGELFTRDRPHPRDPLVAAVILGSLSDGTPKN